MRAILKLPFLVLLFGIGAAAMYIPSGFALAERDYLTSRTFFYFGTFFLILTGMVALATANSKPIRDPRQHLLALVGAYALLPLMLAVPLTEVVRDTRFINGYFEMLSSLTTTGATLFDNPGRVPAAVHLWRALVGWMGGLLAWLAAIAVLAPMNLGGFEVTSDSRIRGEGAGFQIDEVATPSERLIRYTSLLFPIYTLLTIILWVALIILGQSPFEAICYAMSTLATSGILPDTSQTVPLGFQGELMVLLFMVFALTRQSFAAEKTTVKLKALRTDRELRLGIVIILALPAALFLRHWIGAIEVDRTEDLAAGIRSLWGGVFTVASFLTTTGFVSGDWEAAQGWSGLNTPGLILTGLALLGGGVATTAGGVKLLRVHALYRHGVREMERLVHPSVTAGSAGNIGKRGTFVAWVFFMLFAMATALCMALLGLSGLEFEQATTLTIAALSNTGPLASAAVNPPVSYGLLPDTAKIVLMVAMVLGRLEAIALIALLNPDFWRR